MNSMHKEKLIFCISELFLIFGVLLLSTTQVKAQEQAVVREFRFPLEPVKGIWWISQGFGIDYWYQFEDKSRCGYHLGVDFGCEPGTTVFPIADGVIKFAGIWEGAGYIVVIQYKLSETEHVCSVYYHMKRPGEGGIKWDVKANQPIQVSKNDPIGYISGKKKDHSSHPHLHFGIRKESYVEPNPGEDVAIDNRTANWYYPGYTTIIGGECNKASPHHQEILAEWLDPVDFLEQHLKPSQRFIVGDVVKTTGSVNIRTSPEIKKNNIKTVLVAGNVGIVNKDKDNGIFSDGYFWWRFEFGDGKASWCAENYLEKLFNIGNIGDIVRFDNSNGVVSAFEYKKQDYCYCQFDFWEITPVLGRKEFSRQLLYIFGQSYVVHERHFDQYFKSSAFIFYAKNKPMVAGNIIEVQDEARRVVLKILLPTIFQTPTLLQGDKWWRVEVKPFPAPLFWNILSVVFLLNEGQPIPKTNLVK